MRRKTVRVSLKMVALMLVLPLVVGISTLNLLRQCAMMAVGLFVLVNLLVLALAAPWSGRLILSILVLHAPRVSFLEPTVRLLVMAV